MNNKNNFKKCVYVLMFNDPPPASDMYVFEKKSDAIKKFISAAIKINYVLDDIHLMECHTSNNDWVIVAKKREDLFDIKNGDLKINSTNQVTGVISKKDVN